MLADDAGAQALFAQLRQSPRVAPLPTQNAFGPQSEVLCEKIGGASVSFSDCQLRQGNVVIVVAPTPSEQVSQQITDMAPFLVAADTHLSQVEAH